MPISDDQIINWFSYHAPKGDQVEAYEVLRLTARDFARLIVQITPEGADQSAALRKLREVVMTANAAIACGEA